MYIAYSSSDMYSELAATSMVSVLENNKEIDEITFFVIEKGISDVHKKEITEMVKKYNREIVFLPEVDAEKISGTKIEVWKWHISAFARLFILHVLPTEVDRLIYIDCDTIIRKSLEDLWNLDLEGCWIAGADDCRGTLYRKNLGLSDESSYMNSGVMLIDLNAWRNNCVEKEFIDFIKRYNGNITYLDQGVLNGVLNAKGKIKILPIKYNSQAACYYLGYDGLEMCRKPVWAYTKKEFIRDIKDPTVVHFTSCFYAGTRPWEEKDVHPYRDEFLRYRELTPWKNSPLWENKSSAIKKIETKIIRFLPRKLVFMIVRLFHVYLFPIMRNVKNHVK